MRWSQGGGDKRPNEGLSIRVCFFFAFNEKRVPAGPVFGSAAVRKVASDGSGARRELLT